MVANQLCISIPAEMQQFQKVIDILDENRTDESVKDFGVKIIKDNEGNISCTAYYDNDGELLKKIFYSGAAVESVEIYRNHYLYSKENYTNGNIRKKIIYNSYGKIISTIVYEYNRQDKITSIRKTSDNKRYLVEYGYDELSRVNSRSVKIDSEVIAEQYYRYDILDRIVEYKDKNQTILVDKVNTNNELVSYTIFDKIGNTIVVKNKYLYTEYIGSEIDLNGHKTTVKDKSYVDNVMLKKPFTSVDDLDFTISNLTSEKRADLSSCTTKRNNNPNDIMDFIINDNKQIKPPPLTKENILPISIRKRLLLEIA